MAKTFSFTKRKPFTRLPDQSPESQKLIAGFRQKLGNIKRERAARNAKPKKP